MTEFDSTSNLAGFSGTIPLFPLPGTVHFPGVLLPLHVFEERYRLMTADALDGERLIGMALLRPGWEPLYDTASAPIYDTICVGRILAEERLPDGRFHIVLRGEARARLVDECNPVGDGQTAYRVGKVELVDSTATVSPAMEPLLRRRLLDAFRGRAGTSLEHVFHRVLDERVPLDTLCDVFAFATEAPPEEKQRWLDERDVQRRVEALLEFLDVADSDDGTGRGFPPPFSMN